MLTRRYEFYDSVVRGFAACSVRDRDAITHRERHNKMIVTIPKSLTRRDYSMSCVLFPNFEGGDAAMRRANKGRGYRYIENSMLFPANNWISGARYEITVN